MLRGISPLVASLCESGSGSGRKRLFSASSLSLGWRDFFFGGKGTEETVVQKGEKEEEVLLRVAEEFKEEEFNTPETHNLIEKMRKTMLENDGVGLAAPQIGISKRVFVTEVEPIEGLDGMEPLPFTVFFNPKVKALGNTRFQNLESCLSVEEGDLLGLVKRYHKVEIQFQNEEGKHKIMTADGYVAGLVQHENDHLNGILFTDREVELENIVPSPSHLRGSFSYSGEKEP